MRNVTDIAKLLSHSWTARTGNPRDAILQAAVKALAFRHVFVDIRELAKRIDVKPIGAYLYIVVDKEAKSSVVARVVEQYRIGVGREYVVTFYPMTYRKCEKTI